MTTDQIKISKGSPYDKMDKHADDRITHEHVSNNMERPHKNRGYVLRMFAVISLIEGLCCLIAAYLDQTVQILPKDPLVVIGIVCQVAGLVMFIVAIVTCKKCHHNCHSFGKQEDPLENDNNSAQTNDTSLKKEQ